VRGVPELRHGTAPIAGLNRGRAGGEGFGRLFQRQPAQPEADALVALGRPGGPMDEGVGRPRGDAILPSGFTFLGQLVVHDVTFDERSRVELRNDPRKTINVRTAALELDGVYGAGPETSPELYERDDPAKLRVGSADNAFDLARDQEGRALSGDPRDDENVVLAQLHAAFCHFHNNVVEHVRADGGGERAFAQARRLVTWHYQWILVHDFLPRVVDTELVGDVLANGRQYFRWPSRQRPQIPVEFAVAAFRYGHSQVRPTYRLTSDQPEVPIFSPTMTGFQPIPPELTIDWGLFFVRGDSEPQSARRIDAQLASPLLDLPFIAPDEPVERRSLAVRNLLRGRAFELPSGQRAAERMKEHAEPLSEEELGLAGEAPGLTGEAPLWIYVLREAAVRQEGERLGPLGGRIVAEVLLGLLEGDPNSYLSAEPGWSPTLPAARPGAFTMADLLDLADV
jgi:hypothetical protein